MSRWFLIFAALLALPAQAAPLYSVSAPADEQLQALDQAIRGPQRIGYVLPLQLDSSVDGVWQEQGEQRIWSARVYAAGARGLSLQFSKASLPADARLQISADGVATVLDYGVENIRDGRLYTAQLPGDTLTLRLLVPAGQKARLQLGKVNVAYRAPYAKSGSCNIDTVCAASQGHEEKVRSTVLLLYPVGGGSLIACSGFMVNNAREDLTPYLLTADHCEIDADNADSLQVYWKYQDVRCDGSNNASAGAPDSAFSHVGATFLADGYDADFTLLLLGSLDNPFIPPASYQPFWAGWDLSAAPAQCGAGVHHPNGDEKAISFFNTPLRAATVSGDDGIEGRFPDVWEVFWGHGTTEQGSSGSALWNEVGQVVGLLSGGAASCVNRNGADYYARLNSAWEWETACAGQLKCWLDPDSSGVRSLGGADLNGPVPQSASPNCSYTPPSPTPTPTPSGGGGSGALHWLNLLALLLALGQKPVTRKD